MSQQPAFGRICSDKRPVFAAPDMITQNACIEPWSADRKPEYVHHVVFIELDEPAKRVAAET